MFQSIGIFLLMQFFVSQFFGSKQQNATSGSQSNGIPKFSERVDRSQVETYSEVPDIVAPIWPSNCSLDINIYISPSPILPPKLRSLEKDALVLQERNFTLGNYSDTREVETDINIPREVQQNGTLWAHFLVGLAGQQLDPFAKGYDVEKAYHVVHPLTQYLPKKKAKKLKNLLADEYDEDDAKGDNTPNVQLVSYYHPNSTVSFVPNSGTLKYSLLQNPIRRFVPLEATGARDGTGKNGWHYPIIFLNTFWQLKSHMLELNSTVQTVPLRFTLNNLASWKFNMLASLEASSKENARRAAFGGNQTPGGGDGSEFELFKEILLDTNIWLLGTTGIVTVLHMLFETLAFKSDIVSINIAPALFDIRLLIS